MLKSKRSGIGPARRIPAKPARSGGSNGNGLLRVQWVAGAWLYIFGAPSFSLDFLAGIVETNRFKPQERILKQLVRAKITGVGAYVPPDVLTNADLERLVATSNEWILERTGIRERHIAAKG